MPPVFNKFANLSAEFGISVSIKCSRTENTVIFWGLVESLEPYDIFLGLLENRTQKTDLPYT